MSDGFWHWLEARERRRAAYRLVLIRRELDLRSLAKLTFQTLDPRLFVAFAIIGMFGWAFARNMGDDTMKGALIAAFAGAWGFYLGSSNNASRANDRADKALALGQTAMRQLPAPKADITVEPGERKIVQGQPADGESSD